MKIVSHTFGPTHTIVAAIKLYNGYNLDKSKMATCLMRFYHLNGNGPFRLGDTVEIPLIYKD